MSQTLRTRSLKFGLGLALTAACVSASGEQTEQIESPSSTDDVLVIDHGTFVSSTQLPREDESEREPAPTGIYVEENGRIYRSTRANEHCEYQKKLDRIYCYDIESSRRVYVEEQTVYRTTRPKQYYRAGYDPIATGLGVGLAIGIPVLVHNSYDRHYRHNHYGYRGYRGYNRGYYRGYRDGYRNSHYNSHRHKRKHYFKHGKNRY